MNSNIDYKDYLDLFESCGGTDTEYLKHHFPRYVATKQRFLSHWDRARGTNMLDVGAHWLHHAMLYVIDGFSVSALDLPVTFEFENVRAVAQRHGVQLLPNPDLESPTALTAIADDSFDIVLFTEIIEHITFNPVRMWREIYRVLKPGGRIVVTTPNYYALRGRHWSWLRFLQGFGGGIDVLGVLQQHTYAHHWKEYSMRELIYYFCVLSPDFNCVHSDYAEEYQPHYRGEATGNLARWVERIVPMLRPDLYLEVELPRKDKGITVEPHW